jgi:hypothetical protein
MTDERRPKSEGRVFSGFRGLIACVAVDEKSLSAANPNRTLTEKLV